MEVNLLSIPPGMEVGVSICQLAMLTLIPREKPRISRHNC